MANEIGATPHNISDVFEKTYHIDFYQREYKWEKEPVEALFNDIYDKFRLTYKEGENQSLDKIEKAAAQYPWYYLNTYTTNEVEAKVFIVDGQQRLTTLALMLIALYKKSKKEYGSTLAEWIVTKICGFSGHDKEFRMNHEKHIDALQGLFEGKKHQDIDISSGKTAENMVKNYITIEEKLEGTLTTKHKFETFVFYFLRRVFLVNLKVEQADTPLIFEAINDRGISLKPHEILKGKLLGQINKEEVMKYNELWEEQVKEINKESEKKKKEKRDGIDIFFQFYLRAKFANSRTEGEKFGDEKYHREMFLGKSQKELQLKRTQENDGENVEKFLDNEFTYYTDVYLKILNASPDAHPFINYNKWINLNSYYKLILSGLELRDEKEEEKIKTVAYEFDRLRSLLFLQGAYKTHQFNDAEYEISEEIRDKSLDTYQGVFDKYLLKLLTKSKGYPVSSPFQYEFFKDVGLGSCGIDFTRYFLARIEKFLSDEMQEGQRADVGHLLTASYYNKKIYQIEHIIGRNEENYELFKNEEGDYAPFWDERDRLGALLLLEGKINESLGGKPYLEKLDTYARTFLWNQTLGTGIYESKKERVKRLQNRFEFGPLPEKFDAEEVEKRQYSLFLMAKEIWDADRTNEG